MAIIVGWMAGCFGRLEASGAPNRFNCCVIRIFCTQFTNVTAVRTLIDQTLREIT